MENRAQVMQESLGEWPHSRNCVKHCMGCLMKGEVRSNKGEEYSWLFWDASGDFPESSSCPSYDGLVGVSFNMLKRMSMHAQWAVNQWRIASAPCTHMNLVHGLFLCRTARGAKSMSGSFWDHRNCSASFACLTDTSSNRGLFLSSEKKQVSQ